MERSGKKIVETNFSIDSEDLLSFYSLNFEVRMKCSGSTDVCLVLSVDLRSVCLFQPIDLSRLNFKIMIST